MNTIYRSPETEKEFEEYFLFRWKMLRKPLNLPRGSERDELEESAFHMAAYLDQNVIAVGRLHIEPDDSARIRYMAVIEKYQGRGIGSCILKELEQLGRINNVQTCYLYARENAITFYKKNGYIVKGKSNSELSGLLHERMEKKLI